MANVINKVTGKYLKSVHTPDYVGNNDWIINPTPAQIEQYKFVPAEPTEADLAKIELEKTDTDIIRVVDDIIEHLVNGTPIPQQAINKVNARKEHRDKLKK